MSSKRFGARKEERERSIGCHDSATLLQCVRTYLRMGDTDCRRCQPQQTPRHKRIIVLRPRVQFSMFPLSVRASPLSSFPRQLLLYQSIPASQPAARGLKIFKFPFPADCRSRVESSPIALGFAFYFRTTTRRVATDAPEKRAGRCTNFQRFDGKQNKTLRVDIVASVGDTMILVVVTYTHTHTLAKKL